VTGQRYGGREVQERGLKLRIIRRGEMDGVAMRLARQMAQGSRSRLTGMKQQLTAHVHGALEQTYGLELAMHEKTFVGQLETLAQIEKNFYQEVEAHPARELEASSVQETESGPTRTPQLAVEGENDGDVLTAVTGNLKTLLAHELQMRASDIEEDVQFVDLGLDSISGVTWIRKINERYQTAIEATKVYNYPTLKQLSRYVKQEAEKQGKLSPPGAAAGEQVVVAPGKNASSANRPKTKQAGKKLVSWPGREGGGFTRAP